MFHNRHAVGHVAVAAAADAEGLVGGKVAGVQTELRHFQHAVRHVLHRIGDNVDFGVDLARLAADGLHIEEVAGDVGSAHHAQEDGILVHEFQDVFRFYAALGRVGHRNAELAAGAAAVEFNGVIGGGVLNGGGNSVRAPAGVLHDGAYHLEHALGRSQFGNQGAVAGFRTEDDFEDVLDALGLDLLQHQGSVVYALGAVGDLLKLCLGLDGGLQAKGTAGVFEELPFAAQIVLVHIEEPVLDFRLQCRVEEDFFLGDFHIPSFLSVDLEPVLCFHYMVHTPVCEIQIKNNDISIR